jgi:diguanylate cyclase (GGDEF)-like protein/PAS domain S-box-containing protein
MLPDPKTILDNINDGIYFVDPERRITYWNKGAERITGYPADKVISHFCHDNILNHVSENGIQLCHNGCPLKATIADGMSRQAEVYLHHADGHRVPVLIRTSPLYGSDGVIIGGIEIFSDNTLLLKARRRANDLERTVLLDPLTGVGNRLHFELKLQSALSELKQYRLSAGLLFIDIDRFKDVNDRSGHDIGDQVLKMVAHTLERNVRNDDTLARWGGDEFVVLLVGVDQHGLTGTAEKLRSLVENSHLKLEGKEITVTVSIGATLACSEDTSETLIHRADHNMYQGKSHGRNTISTD